MSATIHDIYINDAPPNRKDFTGHTYGDLRVTHYAFSRVYRSGYVTFWGVECSCGVRKDVRSSHLTTGQITSCGDRRAHPPNREDSTHYNVTHKSLYLLRGRATEYQCTATSCQRRATEWAYTHGTDPAGPMNYRPLCRTHHFAYDSMTTVTFGDVRLIGASA